MNHVLIHAVQLNKNQYRNAFSFSLFHLTEKKAVKIETEFTKEFYKIYVLRT